MKYYDFFERIKFWVKDNNTTIESLLNSALEKKVALSVYHGWKERANLPSGEICYDIAQYMGVSCDWLISGHDFSGESGDLMAKYSTIFVDFDKLTPSEQKVIAQLINTLASEKKY